MQHKLSGKLLHAVIGCLWSMGLALLLVIPAESATGAAPFYSVHWAAQLGTPNPENTVLFEDDFATYSNRWNESETPKSSTAYHNDGFQLHVVSPGFSVVSVPDFRLAVDAYTLQTTVTAYAGEADSLFGCALAYQDDDNYFAFLVAVDGDWRFLHVDEGAWIDLSPPDRARVTHTGAPASDQTMTLRVDVAADTFDFWVGTQQLGTVTVDDAPSGSGFGVIARAGHGYVKVMYDTISVTELLGDIERGTTN